MVIESKSCWQEGHTITLHCVPTLQQSVTEGERFRMKMNVLILNFISMF